MLEVTREQYIGPRGCCGGQVVTLNCKVTPSIELTGATSKSSTLPLNSIVLAEVKPAPRIVTDVPNGPAFGESVAMLGAAA